MPPPAPPRDERAEDAQDVDETSQENGILPPAATVARASQSPAQSLDPQGTPGSAQPPPSASLPAQDIPTPGAPDQAPLYGQAYFVPPPQASQYTPSQSPAHAQQAGLPAPPPPLPPAPSPHFQYGPPPSTGPAAAVPSFEPMPVPPPPPPADMAPPPPAAAPASPLPASFPPRRRGPRLDLFPDLPRLRALGTELGRSRPDNGRMSGEMRAAILAAVAAGLPKSVVAECFNVGRRTVNITLNRFAHQGSNRDKPRSGRPRKLSDATERAIAGAGMEMSATALARDYGVSVRTIKRIRRDYEVEAGGRPPRRPDGADGPPGGPGGSGSGDVSGVGAAGAASAAAEDSGSESSASPIVEDEVDEVIPDVQSLAQH